MQEVYDREHHPGVDESGGSLGSESGAAASVASAAESGVPSESDAAAASGECGGHAAAVAHSSRWVPPTPKKQVSLADCFRSPN